MMVTVQVKKDERTKVVDALVSYMDQAGVGTSWTEEDGDLYFEPLPPYEDNPPPTRDEQNEWLLKMAEFFRSYGLRVDVS